MVAYLAKLSFVAAALALQISSSPATASDGTNLRGARGFGSASGHDDGFPFKHSTFLDSALSGFLGLLGPMQGLPSFPTASIRLSIPDNDNGCNVEIFAGKDVTRGTLHLTLNAPERTITATFKKEEAKEDHDPKGESFSARSFHSTSTVLLPKRCIATTAVLLSHMGGYVLDFDDDVADEERRGRIVFPSAHLLREYIDQQSLPASIIDTVAEGEKQHLDNLTPGQLCLAAGFTAENCQKFGDKRPDLPDVDPFNSPEAIPIPRYEVSARLLE